MMKTRMTTTMATMRMMTAARVTPLVAVLVEGDERVSLLRSPEMGSSALCCCAQSWLRGSTSSIWSGPALDGSALASVA